MADMERPKRQKKKSELLTDVELELMTALWALGEGNVRDVMARLTPGRNLAYTSAATILRIMEQKGFVASEKRRNTLAYRPLLARETYQTRTLRDLSDKLFDGTPATLVARLVDDAGISDEALEEIRALLDRKLTDNDR